MSTCGQPLVEADRRGEALHPVGHRLAEPPGPARRRRDGAVRRGGGGALAADMDEWNRVLRRPHAMPTMNAGNVRSSNPATGRPRPENGPHDRGTPAAAALTRRAQCLHATSDMAAIIRQNPNRPALPDFRNMGTVLRILVAVNLGAAVVAYARAPQLSATLHRMGRGDEFRRALPAARAGRAVGGRPQARRACRIASVPDWWRQLPSFPDWPCSRP